jgi:hypothetical protein
LEQQIKGWALDDGLLTISKLLTSTFDELEEIAWVPPKRARGGYHMADIAADKLKEPCCRHHR